MSRLLPFAVLLLAVPVRSEDEGALLTAQRQLTQAFRDAADVDTVVQPPLTALQADPARKAKLQRCADGSRALRAKALAGVGDRDAFEGDLVQVAACLNVSGAELEPILKRYLALPAAQGGGHAGGGTADRRRAEQLSSSGGKALRLVGDPFEDRAAQDMSAAGPSAPAPRNGTAGPGAPLPAMRSSDFSPHGAVVATSAPPPEPVYVPAPKGVIKPVLPIDVKAVSTKLMAACGGPDNALSYVAGARDGGNEIKDRRERVAHLSKITGVQFDDPDSNGGRGDERLRDIDHFLTAWNGSARLLAPSADDGAAAQSAKIFGRQFLAVGTSAGVVLYSGVKAGGQVWVDAFGGNFFGLVNPDTSKASLEEIGTGIHGAWAGTYDRTDYTPPAGTDMAKQVLCRL